MNTSTRRITEGAMMVAIVGLFLFINQQLAGILELMMYWILSFPILIYTVKYGWKAALVPGAAMMFLSVMISMPTTIFYLASALLCGVVYGQGVRSQWLNTILLALTFVFTLGSYIVTTILFASAFGYDVNEDLMIAQQLGEYLQMGNINVVQLAFGVTVIFTVLTAVLQTICVHLLAVVLLRRMKLQAPTLKSVFDCAMPKALGWISIFIWLLFLLRNVLKLEGNILGLVIALYVIDLLLLAAECIMDALCFAIMIRRPFMGVILTLLCLMMLTFTWTRWLIAFFGVASIMSELRRKWKRGAINGTLGKS